MVWDQDFRFKLHVVLIQILLNAIRSCYIWSIPYIMHLYIVQVLYSKENLNFSQLTSNTLSQQTRYTVCILPTAAAPQACLSVSSSATFSHMSNSLLYLSMSRRLVAVVKSVPWVRVAPPHRYRSPPRATREAWHRGMRISPRRVHL